MADGGFHDDGGYPDMDMSSLSGAPTQAMGDICFSTNVSPSSTASAASAEAEGHADEVDAMFGGDTGAEENEEAGAQLPSAGLVNEGCTCYLNSLLQLLFHLGFFRNAVYRTPVVEEDSCSIHQALQELFFHMQTRKTPARTKKLTDAFGWAETELYVQHDIQEMATLLRDNLEEKMKGTVTEGIINQLFEGVGEQVVATLDGTFSSRRRDTYYDIHLPLNSHTTLMDSLRSLTAKDQLVGDNKYRVEIAGKEPEYKEATTSYEFCRFPPVVWFHLKRFDIDLTSPLLEMKKINSRLEFPVELDLREIENGSINEEGMGMGSKSSLNTPTSTEKKKEKNARADMETTREEGGNEEEAEKKIENGGNDAQPFLTDSPAIYDLHGVIVHRGSIRSGHYYCYIREWDHVKQAFTRWLEFDDERVRVVSEDVAVSDNFGGTYSRRMTQCRFVAAPVINNAYILSYVRRADCSTVFAPSPIDIIPRQVKEVISRGICEDKRYAEEECERQRHVTVHVLTDDTIRTHVEMKQSRTLRLDATLFEPVAIELDLKKSDSLIKLYEVIATHLEVHRVGLSASTLRLWLCLKSRSFRPLEPLPTCNEPNANSQISNFIEAGSERPAELCVYVERATKPLPVSLVEVTQFQVRSLVQKKNALSGRLFLSKCVALNAVNLLIQITRDIQVEARVRVSLCGGSLSSDGSILEYETSFNICRSDWVRVQVNSEQCLVGEVEYDVEVIPRKDFPFVYVQEVRIMAPTTRKSELLDTKDVMLLPPVDDSHRLLFFKYYNCTTGRVTYAGSAMVSASLNIAGCVDVLRYLLGDNNTKEDIQMFEERYGKTAQPLTNLCTLINANIEHGAFLVGQRDKPPFVFRQKFFKDYLQEFQNTMQVQVIHIEFLASTDMLKSKQASQYTASSSSPVCLSRSSSLTSVDMSLFSYVDVQIPSHASDKIAAHYNMGVNDDTKFTSFYPSRQFKRLRIYRRLLSTCWDYATVCEAIGSMSGCDANFIRLYHCNDRGMPNLDPVLSCTKATAGMLCSNCENQLPILYFDVHDEPRRILESRPHVIVTVRSECNEPLYIEKLILKKPLPIGDLTRRVIRSCAAALAKQAVNPHAMENNSAYNMTEQEPSETATIEPFQVGSHSLALVLGTGSNFIKDIVEIPLDESISSINTSGFPFSTSSSYMSSISDPSSETYVIDLVLARPLQSGQFRLGCSYGCWNNDVHMMDPPLLFGHPFVVTVSTSITALGARNLLLALAGVQASELETSSQGVLMQIGAGYHILQPTEQVFQFCKDKGIRINRVPTLIVNHRRPRDKIGPKQVAHSNPTLRITKK